MSLVTTQFHQLQHNITSHNIVSPVTTQYHQLQSYNCATNCILNSEFKLFLLEYFLLLTIKKKYRKRYEFPQFYSKSGNFTLLAMSKGTAAARKVTKYRAVDSQMLRRYPEIYKTAEQTANSRKTDHLLTQQLGGTWHLIAWRPNAYELRAQFL